MPKISFWNWITKQASGNKDPIVTRVVQWTVCVSASNSYFENIIPVRYLEVEPLVSNQFTRVKPRISDKLSLGHVRRVQEEGGCVQDRK